MLNELFYKFDIFKTPFLLRTNSKEQTSTLLGFIISLGVIIFLSIFFSNSDIFHHQRPNINDQTIQLAKKEKFYLNSENFHLVVGITDELGSPFQDDSLFKLTLKQIKVNSSSKETLQEDKYFHICNHSDFKDNSNEFTINGFKDYFCLDDNNILLEGGWDEDLVSFFAIRLEMCNNNTYNNQCKDPEFILNQLTDKYLSIYFKDTFYDLNDYEHPFNSGYKNQYWSLGSKIRKIISIYLKKIEIITDDGYIFENLLSEISFKQDEVSYDLDFNYESYLIEIDFYSSYRKQFARRSYQKFQEVIAGMGGIFSFLLHLGYFFTITQNSLNRINLIMNQLYTFPKINNDENKKKGFNLPCNKNRNKSKSKNKKAINFDKFSVNQTKIKESYIKNQEKNNTQTQNSKIIYSHSNQKLNENNCNNNNGSTIINNYEKSKENIIKQIDDFDNWRNNPSKYFDELDIGEIKNITRANNSLKKDKKEINEILKAQAKKKSFKRYKNETIQLTKNNNLNILQNKYVQTSKFHFSLLNLYVLKIKKIFRLKLNYKEKLYIKTEKVFLKEVDITSILNRLHEITKIKLLLFNKRQISLLNLLSKPMIFLKNVELLKNSINSQINMNNASYRMSTILKSVSPKIKNKNKINEQYQETLKKTNENEIDRKLIKFLDEEANKITFLNKN